MIPSAQNKLQIALQIATETCSLTGVIIEMLSPKLQELGQRLRWRDRVLIGLALKMCRSFECLVEDAKRERLEAMHHLKTLTETFIYLTWANKDSGESRSRLIFAEGCRNKISFFKKNPGYTNKEQIEEWEKCLKELTVGREKEWKEFKKKSKLEQLAKDVGPWLVQWYNRIYKLACEPAHIADLPQHMPQRNGKISLNQPKIAVLQALIALDYGLNIIWGLMKEASKRYGLKEEQKIIELEARWEEVRMQPN